MGRKKKEEEVLEESFLRALKEETVEAVLGIVFILLALLLIMAAFGKAGFVGNKLYTLFNALFGIGYALVPITLGFLGVSFLINLKKKFAWPKVTGSILFLISGLGVIQLTSKSGGLMGQLIASPAEKLFDFWAALILLIALLFISVLITLNTGVDFIVNLFKKNEEDENVISLREDNEEKDEETEEEASDDEEDEDEDISVNVPEESQPAKASKNKGGLIFFSRKSISNHVFTPPPLSILEKDSGKPGVGDVKANANIIKRTLHNFGISVEMDEVSIGPSVTRYALKPAEGVKLAKIVGLQNDLALALAAHPIRIEAPIPGKSLVGIEIPNSTKTKVGLGSILKSDLFQNAEKPLMMGLGKGVSGLPHFANMAKMPHLLIAGATGSGKSVTINALITSLLFRNPPESLKFIMVDPKRVELTPYNKIPHLLTPVITDAKKAILSLKWAAKEMDRRYDVLEEHKVRDIDSYHNTILKPAVEKAQKKKDLEAEIPEAMPYIVIVIDELADIMQTYPRELESAIVRLAQMSRAVGIHLILSTQRPSVNVITGLIKANVPSRIALQVSSQVDSRTILDMAGAEKLLGAGDMLYLSGEMSKPVRVQSAFISEKEVKDLVEYLIDQYADELPDEGINFNEKERSPIFDELEKSGSGGGFDDEEDEDDLYEDAKEIVISAGKASTSYIQRKLRVGYARAARLIDMLEERGVVGPADGSKPREVLDGGDVNEEMDDDEGEYEKE